MVKNPPANAGDVDLTPGVGKVPWGWEDPLEKEMAIHSLAWRIPWTEEPDVL